MTLAFAAPSRAPAWPDALRLPRPDPTRPVKLGIELDTGVACRQYDPDLWFADTPADLEVAKALCGGCPLKAECLAGAIERAEPWGVWGGEIFERGVVIPRKRPRGRPRKEDLVRDGVLRLEHSQTTAAVKAA